MHASLLLIAGLPQASSSMGEQPVSLLAGFQDRAGMYMHGILRLRAEVSLINPYLDNGVPMRPEDGDARCCKAAR